MTLETERISLNSFNQGYYSVFIGHKEMTFAKLMLTRVPLSSLHRTSMYLKCLLTLKL